MFVTDFNFKIKMPQTVQHNVKPKTKFRIVFKCAKKRLSQTLVCCLQADASVFDFLLMGLCVIIKQGTIIEGKDQYS